MTQNPFDALGGGGFDMNALLQQAQQMQEQLQERPGAAGRAEVDGHGRRRRGHGDRQRRRRAARRGHHAPASSTAPTPTTSPTSSDMIVAAYRDAKAKADALASEALGPLAGGLEGLGGGLPGLGGRELGGPPSGQLGF